MLRSWLSFPALALVAVLGPLGGCTQMSGSGRVGLPTDRGNENRGAESVLAYLLALVDIRLSVRENSAHSLKPALRALTV